MKASDEITRAVHDELKYVFIGIGWFKRIFSPEVK